MANAEMDKAAEKRRLAWRCRRGMLEVDIVLQQFVEQYFETLTLPELKAFDALLDLPDSDLWNDIKLNNKNPKNADELSLIEKLNALQGVN